MSKGRDEIFWLDMIGFPDGFSGCSKGCMYGDEAYDEGNQAARDFNFGQCSYAEYALIMKLVPLSLPFDACKVIRL